MNKVTKTQGNVVWNTMNEERNKIMAQVVKNLEQVYDPEMPKYFCDTFRFDIRHRNIRE